MSFIKLISNSSIFKAVILATAVVACEGTDLNSRGKSNKPANNPADQLEGLDGYIVNDRVSGRDGGTIKSDIGNVILEPGLSASDLSIRIRKYDNEDERILSKELSSVILSDIAFVEVLNADSGNQISPNELAGPVKVVLRVPASVSQSLIDAIVIINPNTANSQKYRIPNSSLSIALEGESYVVTIYVTHANFLVGLISAGEPTIELVSDTFAEPDQTVETPTVTQRYIESNLAFRNPGKGWLPYIFNTGNVESVDDTPLASAYYTNNLSWGDLEPTREGFDWTRLNNLVAFAKSKGKKLRFSLNSVDPTTRSLTYRPQIPYWFIAANPTAGRWISSYYGAAIDPTAVSPYNATPGYIFEPDYASSAYTQEYFRFLSKLTEKWQSTQEWKDTIETFEISNYGLWGEWHSDFPWTAEWVKTAVLRGFVDWYFALLPGAKGSYTTPRLEISSLFHAFGDSAVAHAVTEGADMTRKCIGICEHGFITDADYQAIKSFRQWRSFRAEFGSWSGAIEKFYSSATSTTPVNTTKGAIDEALTKFSADHLGWYVGATLSKPSGVAGESFAEYFQKRAGYRLYVESISYPRKVRAGDAVAFDQVWFQRGVSKMYLKPKFAVDLVKDGKRFPIGEVDFAACSWTIGPQGPISTTSSMTIPDLAPGQYQVSFALVDEKRKPMINIAIDQKETADIHAYSFYNAGSITIQK